MEVDLMLGIPTDMVTLDPTEPLQIVALLPMEPEQTAFQYLSEWSYNLGRAIEMPRLTRDGHSQVLSEDSSGNPLTYASAETVLGAWNNIQVTDARVLAALAYLEQLPSEQLIVLLWD